MNLLPDAQLCHELLYGLTRPPHQFRDVYGPDGDVHAIVGELLFQAGWRRGRNCFEPERPLYVVSPTDAVYRLHDLAPINDAGRDEVEGHVLWLWGYQIYTLLTHHAETLTAPPPGV